MYAHFEWVYHAEVTFWVGFVQQGEIWITDNVETVIKDFVVDMESFGEGGMLFRNSCIDEVYLPYAAVRSKTDSVIGQESDCSAA